MKKFVLLMMIICLISAMFVLGSCSLFAKQEAVAVDSETVYRNLADVYVYGEQALFFVFDQENNVPAHWQTNLTLLHQPANAEEKQPARSINVVCGDSVNQGLCLWQLASGSYTFQIGGIPLAAEGFTVLDGYTLPRDGLRKHWQFSEQDGLLLLTISEVDSLPDGYADIFIDVGHGGADTGAAAFGYVEAEENLRSSQYMQQLLEEKGLKVLLSRENMRIPGGDEAEDNPYISGARVDSLYRSGASYLLSNHLNGGGGSESGFQLYTSVMTDTAWADEIAKQWRALGWYHNNGNIGVVKDGVYKRWARDNIHTGRDYYFILRETGGMALTPSRYRVYHDEMAAPLRKGAEGILLEYLFLDNRHDMDYWDANYQELVEAVLNGCYDYWQLD